MTNRFGLDSVNSLHILSSIRYSAPLPDILNVFLTFYTIIVVGTEWWLCLLRVLHGSSNHGHGEAIQ